MITIVKPRLDKSASEVSIVDVLEDRFIHELRDDTDAIRKAETLAKAYRQSSVELPRCRLKATLYYMGQKISGVSDEDIIDSQDKVSCINFEINAIVCSISIIILECWQLCH